MKLEQKHATPYLPYEARIKNETTEMPLSGAYLDELNDPLWGFDDSYKLILYPLADYEKFNEIVLEMTNYEMDMIDDNPDLVGRLSYDVMEMMFKYHIDVFGLLNKGLAINKNTI